MLNLDTHIVIDAARDNLSAAEISRLARTPQHGISAIVLWEIELLHRGGRIRAGLDDPALAAILDTLIVWPLDRDVCLALRRLDFHADPADEIIAATTLVHRVPLVTRDRRLRSSSLLHRLHLLALD